MRNFTLLYHFHELFFKYIHYSYILRIRPLSYQYYCDYEFKFPLILFSILNKSFVFKNTCANASLSLMYIMQVSFHIFYNICGKLFHSLHHNFVTLLNVLYLFELFSNDYCIHYSYTHS